MDKNVSVQVIDSKIIEIKRKDVDQDGKETINVINKEFDYVYPRLYFLGVHKKEKRGLLSLDGDEVLPCRYNLISIDPSGFVTAWKKNEVDKFFFLSRDIDENKYFRVYREYDNYYVLTTKTGKKFAIYSLRKNRILFDNLNRKDFRILNGDKYIVNDRKSGKIFFIRQEEVEEVLSVVHFEKGALVQKADGKSYCFVGSGSSYIMELGEKL